MSETYEELLTRHRREQRDLIATTTSLKKSVTKGEKRKKKEITAKCEQMERDLAAKQFDEVQAFESRNDTGKGEQERENNKNEEEAEEEISADQLLAQLSLAIKTTDDLSTSHSSTDQQQQEQQQQQPKSKKNRQKDRLARKKAALDQMAAEAAAEAAQTPDLRKIEMENIKSLTERLGLVEYDITPDGHCLFASLADQLKFRHKLSSAPTISSLRTLAATHIRGDPDTFAPFLFDETTMSVRELEPYCVELESTAVWGGEMEILAIAREFDCAVNVIMSGRARLRMNEEGKNAELWVAYYKHSYGLGEHYNSLRDKS
ncbi:uncharacterized protein V2V93DRAFT_369306 [Kockiozyma suomiensis]|uniref:uncharacterized protein n=1 Tax=Kockiozyma suomiensis TaxID=1337062 RepID=UPI003343FADA